MEKECFKCNKTKPLDAFYKHKEMADGYLNKCKKCTKKEAKKRYNENKKNPEWRKKERRRGREKYHRLNYNEKYEGPSNEVRKRWEEKFPEKVEASNKAQHIPREKEVIHHWSYKEKHFKDVIHLMVKEHYKAHRFLVYDQERRMFRTTENVLLDTKERHKKYIFDKIENEPF